MVVISDVAVLTQAINVRSWARRVRSRASAVLEFSAARVVTSMLLERTRSWFYDVSQLAGPRGASDAAEAQ